MDTDSISFLNHLIDLNTFSICCYMVQCLLECISSCVKHDQSKHALCLYYHQSTSFCYFRSHSPGSTSRISSTVPTQTSTAGSSASGASPAFVASAASALPPSLMPPPARPFPTTNTVRIPISAAARTFLVLSSTMTHSSGVSAQPIRFSTSKKAPGSGLHSGSTSSTAYTDAGGKTPSRPSSFRTLSTYFLGPLLNATSFSGHASSAEMRPGSGPPRSEKSRRVAHHLWKRNAERGAAGCSGVPPQKRASMGDAVSFYMTYSDRSPASNSLFPSCGARVPGNRPSSSATARPFAVEWYRAKYSSRTAFAEASSAKPSRDIMNDVAPVPLRWAVKPVPTS
mmetsp:Transcript_31419/g.62245  ORF Transcript_31419/g.62245 Transcript_31419/m.62245 type:complete len:340 (-) Transcript_31419:131-1150(-)